MPLPIVKPPTSGGGDRKPPPRQPSRPSPEEPRQPFRPETLPENQAPQATQPRRTPPVAPQPAPARNRKVDENKPRRKPNPRPEESSHLNNTAKKTTAEPEELPVGWEIDPTTKVKHRVLPKTEWDEDRPGHSVVHLEDTYDATYDLNSIANDFLSHLQVPPDKEEQKRLLAEKMRLKKEQEEAYADELARLAEILDDKDENNEENEDL